MRLKSCDLCGAVRESKDQEWYSVYSGTGCWIIEPAALSQRVGDKDACSRQCAVRLLIRWCDTWREKAEKVVA